MAQDDDLDDYEDLARNFVGAIQAATRFEELFALCSVYYATHGVVMSSFHHIPPLGAVDHRRTLTLYAEGFPKDWVTKYKSERLYEIDPIPRLALSSAEPFWWSDARGLAPISKKEKSYLDMLEEADLGDGLAIPVFGPHGRNGYIGLGFGKKNNREEVSKLTVSRLQSASQIGHQRYCMLLASNNDSDIHLSGREQEILTWIINGKSNSVIAEIIGVSSYTVDTYLRRIYAKLDVSNRVAAALRAVALGLI